MRSIVPCTHNVERSDIVPCLMCDVNNDVELFLSLKDRVKRICDEYSVELLQLYGVVFA